MGANDGELDPTLTPDTIPGGAPDFGGDRGGYEVGALLGRGGMGEVVLARDRRIGRDVALKRLVASQPSAEAIARFHREATIQARLDHPAIVPVHEIGLDGDGRPFFTMKRLVGRTLAELIATRGATLQTMLRAVVDVCMAIELAHSRGVIHRDLKPSNIMLGDFGEVYVLDWGVARVLAGPGSEDIPTLDDSEPAPATQAGRVLGTPGYIAPETVHGDPAGPAADVYALGAILFEMLTITPLYPRGLAALTTTLEPADRSPAARRPDLAIPPELDAACSAALADEPAQRPSARALGDQIQRYLDGDRDVERRRARALAELAAARAALAAGDRAEAVHLAGRAVALDPGDAAGVALLTSLIVEPPAELPREIAEAFDAEERQLVRARSRRALIPYLSFFSITPLIRWLDVVSWPQLIALYAAMAMVTVLAYVNWRIRAIPLWLALASQLATVVLFARLTSPFVLTPTLIAGMLLGASAIPWLTSRRWALLGWALAASLIPFAIEQLGWLPPTWRLGADGLVIRGTVFAPRSALDAAVIAASNIAIVALIALYTLAIARDRRAAQRGLYVQAWHLKQLLPRGASARAA